MTVLEKTAILSSVNRSKEKLEYEYEMVENHYKSVCAGDHEKYREEMEFYNFILEQWDQYKIKVEKDSLSYN
ncbi:hypothetical protein QQ008_06275 [Fulvivirgaceae bacterium BMA10]|uniref:Uncharacterized protein n=1 Tax=Splendidivirga corallicola TaxID=3051826 RepID=A0ABT8KN45_9BACT|nr:hypothetical protein [Fulvivirgaceae bacterium BMA10]